MIFSYMPHMIRIFDAWVSHAIQLDIYVCFDNIRVILLLIF